MEIINTSGFQPKQRPLSQQIGQRKMAYLQQNNRNNLKTANKLRNIKSGNQKSFNNTNAFNNNNNNNNNNFGGKIFKGTVLSQFQKPQVEENDQQQDFNYSPYQQARPKTGLLPQTVFNQQQNQFSNTNQNFFDQIIPSNARPSKKQYQPPRTAPTGNNSRQKNRNLNSNQGSKGRDFLQLFSDTQLVESTIFPSIFYAKTSLRNLLQELIFPKNIKPLNPNDERTPIVFQIMIKLFYEIKFFIFNILVCQHSISKNFLVFFSDAESIPFSKCCNSPIYVELDDNGQGKVLCNSQTCSSNLLTEFLINYDDGQKLWQDQIVFREKNDRDDILRKQVSKLINTGKFKSKSLAKELKKQQKNLCNLFENQQYSQSRSQFLQDTLQQQQEFNDFNMLIEQDSPLANNNNKNFKPQGSQKQFNNFIQPSTTNNNKINVGVSRINNYNNLKKQGSKRIQSSNIGQNPNIYLKQLQKKQGLIIQKPNNKYQNIKNIEANGFQNNKIKNDTNSIQEDEQTLVDIKNMINDMLI